MSSNEDPIQPSEVDCNISNVYANSSTSIELKINGLNEDRNGELPHQQKSFTGARKERKNPISNIFRGTSFCIWVQ